jgi:hypothetical protein
MMHLFTKGRLYRCLLFFVAFFTPFLAAAQGISLNHIGRFATGRFDAGAAEISAFDPTTARLFFTSADLNELTILDLSDPSAPTEITTIDLSVYGGGVNSVAVHSGVVAVAVEEATTDGAGTVVFFDTDGTYLHDVAVGVLPDMVTFTPDGTKVLTANEGEPSDDYTVDPEGSVSIVDLSGGVATATVTTVGFTDFNVGGPRNGEQRPRRRGCSHGHRGRHRRPQLQGPQRDGQWPRRQRQGQPDQHRLLARPRAVPARRHRSV